MSNQNTYKPGVWNALCDVCGGKFKSDELKRRWDGLMTCESDWEPRHPQDYLRARKDTSMTLPWSSPDNDGIDGSPTYTTLYVMPGYIDNPPFQFYVEEL